MVPDLPGGHVQSNGRSHQIMKEFNMTLEETLNDLLVKLFKDILEIEAKSLITEEFKDISYNDMHIIEAIGLTGKTTMSVVAKKMKITAGSLTTAMNALVNKKYVLRERGEKDRRVVYIWLTEKGQRAYRHHAKFHEQMTNAVIEELDETEIPVLLKTLRGLDTFFRSYSDNQDRS